MKRCTLFAPAFMTSACLLDTGARPVEVELRVGGTDVGAEFDGRDGARISLERANLAFGPLYICRGPEAGEEACDVAALEWTEAAVIDALDATPDTVGTLVGTEGRVRSYMYDLGLHSLLTQDSPLVLPAARELDGHSVVLVGQAMHDGRALPFRFEVAVEVPEVFQGVPAVVAAGQAFDEEVDPQTARLTVRFDPRTWLRDVNFDQFVDDRTCADEKSPSRLCAGDTWQTCDGSGGVADEVDCTANDRVCVADEGCREAFTAPPGSQAWSAIRNGLVAGERPRFRWSRR